MFSKTALGLAAGLILAVPVFADDDYRPYGDDFDYAEVVNVEPNLRQVRISVPRQECYSATRYVPGEGRGYGHERPAAGAMILGGLFGAVIGHQFDHGHERGAATVAGAVIGSALGHDAAQRQGNGGNMAAVESERCETRYDERYESRVESYQVSYRYHGRTYQTTLPRDPGQQLRVRVAVTPAE
jgi:uncharacterized protein YcfJ